jgi:CRP-like cAMP-binding protein
MPTIDQDLFRGLGEDDAARILGLGRPIRLAAGQELFALGADAGDVYLVERGHLALTLPMHVGGRDQDILVEERKAGQIVGWSGLIAPHRFTLKATAQIETDVRALPRAALLAYFEQHPAAGYTVMRNLASAVGQRLQVFQAMWLREMQRVVELRAS